MKLTNLHEARTRLQQVRDEATAIVEAADNNPENPGKFSEEQQQRFDALMAEEDSIRAEFPGAGRKTAPQQVPYQDGTGGLVRRAGTPGRRPATFMSASGQPIHSYRHNEPLSADPDMSIGDLVRGIAIGDLSGVDPSIRSAVTTGGEGGGAYMLQPELSSRVVDLARSASVVMRAGAQTVPMNSGEMRVLRVLRDPTVNPRRETQGVSASSPTFGQFTLQSKMHAAIVPVSMEQLEDSANAAQLIEQTLRNALGLSMDRAILTGAGGASVVGITQADGTNEQTSVGTPSDWSDVSQAIGSIYSANFTGDPSELAWIHNPRDGGTYDRLIGGDNQPLRPSPWAGAVQRLMTTSLEADGGATDMIVGDFSEVLIGMRTAGVVIDVVDAGSVTDANGDSFNATSDFMRFIRARIRFDALLMRPDHFTVLRGVTAA